MTALEIPPLRDRLTRKLRVGLTESDYKRIAKFARERGERGPGAALRTLAMAALDELEKGRRKK